MAQPRFHFPLEALLEHRRAAERDHMRKVALAQQEVQSLLSTIRTAQQRILDENRALSTTHLTGRLDMSAIAFGKRYVGNLHVQIVLTAQKLAAAEQKVAAARAQLLQAARARKVIEKLREKQHARWLAELERKDAALMDEIGTQIAIREAARIEAESPTIPQPAGDP
ncbi:MAG TPA: flagellar export protein FliJ [Phycisphaerae bacterium]|nr:flagellar export protein FliJ [Phycisphaerae bacterium]